MAQSASSNGRELSIRAAGILVGLLGAGALLLPWLDIRQSSRLVGYLMLAAGSLEAVAGLARRHERIPAVAAGAVTAAAGLLLVLNPRSFLPVLNIVIAWLLLRGAILIFAALQCDSFPRRWTFLAAGVDILLALLLIAGLQISLLVIGIFGPSTTIVSSFAWVLAISFLATGALLLGSAEDACTATPRKLSSAEPASDS